MPTYKCFTCGEGFWSRPELHAHISRQHPATSDEVQCRWCTYTCHWKDRFHLLVIHVRQHHPGHQDQYCKWRRVSSSGTTFAHQRPEVVADRSRQRRHYAPIREELDQAYIEWLDLPQQHPTLGVEDWDAILEDGPVTPPSPHVVCEEPPASPAEAMPSSPASTVGYSHPTAPQPYVPLTSPVSSWGQSPQCKLLSEEEGGSVEMMPSALPIGLEEPATLPAPDTPEPALQELALPSPLPAPGQGLDSQGAMEKGPQVEGSAITGRPRSRSALRVRRRLPMVLTRRAHTKRRRGLGVPMPPQGPHGATLCGGK